MIKIEIQRGTKNNTLELQIKAMLNNIKFWCDTLDQYKREFDNAIKKLPRPNTVIPELTYKCFKPSSRVIGEPECLEVWHSNSTGYHDRCIAKIFIQEEQ